MGTKKAKDDVDYEDPAKIPSKHCSVCDHWEGKFRCELVAGHIEPTAWCKLFEFMGKILQ